MSNNRTFTSLEVNVIKTNNIIANNAICRNINTKNIDKKLVLIEQNNNIKLGTQAGNGSIPGSNCIAIGDLAASLSQNGNSIAIGIEAGQTQDFSCIGIGYRSQQNCRNTIFGSFLNIGIGTESCQVTQQFNSVGIGYRSNQSNSNPYLTSIGRETCQSNTLHVVAIGNKAGQFGNIQNWAVSIGNMAGQFNAFENTVAIGLQAGQNAQSTLSVALGNFAGNLSQSINAVSIGNNAGQFTQGTNSVAIGNNAGRYSQNINNVAIGDNSSVFTQEFGCVSIGNNITQTRSNTVSVGFNINNNQSNTVILNPLSSNFTANNSGFYVTNVRKLGATNNNLLMYNTLTYEIYYT